MAAIPLTRGFKLVSEGSHVFTITDVKYNEEFGKVEVHTKTENDEKHIERFMFKKKNGDDNPGGHNAFSHFVHAVTDNQELDSIEPSDLVGVRFTATVSHEDVPSSKKPGSTITVAKLDDVSAMPEDPDGETLNLDDLL